jgi:REP element-mobilizing transposase RayT
MPQEHPRRPPRLRAVFQNQRPLYFVTFNTYKRSAILANEAVHNCWLEFARRSPQHGAWVGRYVIMPDHVHLFVWLDQAGNLAKWVQSLRSVLGKELLRLGHAKPHWQEGFFDHLLRSNESYAEKWEYVRQNPVRKGLCVRPENWPYQGEIEALPWV